LTISWKLLATKSGCFARCAATINELTAAGGGSTFFASICTQQNTTSNKLPIRKLK
jgi:hypothetical protein